MKSGKMDVSAGFVVSTGPRTAGRKRDVEVCSLADKATGLVLIATSIGLGYVLAQNGAFIGQTTARTCLSCKGKGKVKCPVCKGAKVVRGGADSNLQYARRCERCAGEGSLVCGICDGQGV